MTDFDVLKASGMKNFIQCYDKNLTLTQERKVTVAAKSSFAFSDFGKINIKGLFSLFKSSERYISPFLSLEHENYFQINYNLMKNSASMNVSFPKENAFIRSVSYQITPDKTNCKLTQNKLNFIFKNNLKFTFNHDSNESFMHISSKVNNIGRFKYKWNNKGKNNVQISLNRSLFRNYLIYFNNIELNANNLFQYNKNVHGLVANFYLNNAFTFNVLGGFGFNQDKVNNSTLGLYSRHALTNALKFENGFIVNKVVGNNEIKMGYVGCLSFRNLFIFKVRVLKNEVKSYINLNLKNVTISTNLSLDSSLPLNAKGAVKYSVNCNLKW